MNPVPRRLTQLLAVLLAAGAVFFVADMAGREDKINEPRGAKSMVSDFDRTMISEFKRIDELRLWRVGDSAVGPGQKRPSEGMPRHAWDNNLTWAFTIDGDGRFDSDGLNMPSNAEPADVQAALVGLIEDATGRHVSAEWSEVDPDSWSAPASFDD